MDGKETSNSQNPCAQSLQRTKPGPLLGDFAQALSLIHNRYIGESLRQSISLTRKTIQMFHNAVEESWAFAI